MSQLAFEKAAYSGDPEIIRAWADDILADGLIRPDGIAQFSLARPDTIDGMAYLSGVAWIFYGTPVIAADGRRGRFSKWQAFVRPDRRRKGIGSRLFAYAIGHREARGLPV